MMIAPLLPVLMLITATGSAIGLLRPPVPLPALVFRNGWPNQACSVQTPARCSAVAAAPAFSIGIMQSCAGIAQSCVGITLSCAGITQSCAGLVQYSLLPSIKTTISTASAASITAGALVRRLRLSSPRLIIIPIFLWAFWHVVRRRQSASRRSVDMQGELTGGNVVGMAIERDVRARRDDNTAVPPRYPFPWASGQHHDTANGIGSVKHAQEPAIALWGLFEAIAGATADAAAQSAALAFSFTTEMVDGSANDEVQPTHPLPPAELAPPATSTSASSTDVIRNGKVVPTAIGRAKVEVTKATKLPKSTNNWLFQ
mmetsp:Transcript_25001/g.41419  ORF Transcript_25001/g.41419 Transcript_25001/m.41419 type:complete len:315 (-) Transcript_25001:431-1375(-)